MPALLAGELPLDSQEELAELRQKSRGISVTASALITNNGCASWLAGGERL
jgi:hypothetical protein